MAPVVITWNNSVAGYFTAAKASGETWVRLHDAMTAWVAGIGEPDTVTVLETYAQTVDTGDFSSLKLGFHKNVGTGQFQYGFGLYKFGGDFNLLNLQNFYNLSAGTTLSNGHKTGGLAYNYQSGLSRSVANNSSPITIVYNTTPGDQYFHYMDGAANTSFTLFRFVRPPASTYPSNAQAAEFGNFLVGATVRTFANGPILENVPWSVSDSNYPIQPLDSGYIFTGAPVFTRSLFVGNLPPGVGLTLSSTPLGTITTVGSETWITGSAGITVRRSV